MIWRGCLFIIIVFLVFGAALYGLYGLLTSDDSQMALMSPEEYAGWIDYDSEQLRAVIRQKDSNYPHNQSISAEISDLISDLTGEEVLTLLAQVYMDKPPTIQSLDADGLKGLTLEHGALLASKLAAFDATRRYALLQSYLLRDVRAVSNTGAEQWQNAVISQYTDGYLQDQQMVVALSELPGSVTFQLISKLGLFDKDSTLTGDLSPTMAGSVVSNLLAADLDQHPEARRFIEEVSRASPEHHSVAIYEIYQSLGKEGQEWHEGLFYSMVSTANDDVLTDFLEMTPYVKHRWWGLYKTFDAQVMAAIPAESRNMMIARLEVGLVTPFESQAIEDLGGAGISEVDETSLNYYSDLINTDPNEPSNYFERGRILANEYQDYQRAIEDFNQSILLDRTYSDAYFHRSMSREKLNDINGSIADYDTVLLYDPDNLYALGNRGIMKHQIGDYRGAVADYSETLSLDSTYVDALYGRALSRAYLGDTVGALEDYGGSIVLDSYYVNSYLNRALINLELESSELALDDYLKVLEIKSDHLDGLYGAAYAYYQLDSMDLATDYYSRISRDYPDEVGAVYSLGVIYFDEENYQTAYSFFTKSIFMDSTYSDAFLQRGMTSLNLGDTIQACLDWVNAKNAGMDEANSYLNSYCKN